MFFALLNEFLSVSGILNFLHGFILELTSSICKNDLSQALLEIGSYLYPDNLCISYKYKYFEKTEAALNKEFSSIC